MIATTDASDPVGIAEALVGLPVATVVVAVVLVIGWALNRRIIVLGRELTVVETLRAEALVALEESHARELEQVDETIAELRTERDWWRDTAVRALDLGERAVASSRDRR